MITRRELEQLARKQRLSLGNAEKDYLLDHILATISRMNLVSLIFKGGTCLYKFYSLPRFSEDLDFSAGERFSIDEFIQKIIFELDKEGISAQEIARKEPYNSVLITLRIKGPLFNHIPMSLASVGIDINFKSSVLLPTTQLTYLSQYPKIGEISVPCMTQEEIFAEKIRALLSRKKARDLFDLYFLIEQGVSPPKQLFDEKMSYYNEPFSLVKLLKRIKELKEIWEKEISALSRYAHSFEIVFVTVTQKLIELYS